jgi:hypothetical protein
MTDTELRERAIRVLEGNYKNSVLRHNRELVTVNEILDLLKEQEPVKPIERNGFYYCGSCRYAFTVNKQKYCSNCGQAVKWE